MDSYKYFGKYFTIDSVNGTNKFHISSFESDSRPTAHQIEIMSVCTHSQEYDSTSDTCKDLTERLTIGLQESPSTMCANNNEMIEYNRRVGDSVCDYGCNDKLFGIKCEVCSVFMARIGHSAPSGYSWNDNSPNVCRLISDTSGIEFCTDINICSRCIFSGLCAFSNYKCEITTTSFSLTPSNIDSKCSKEGISEHDSFYCGPSSIDMTKFNSTYNVKPDNMTTPMGTLCKYELTNGNSKFTDVFSFTIDQDVIVTVKKTVGRIVSTVTPTIRRILSDGRRNLATKSYSYSVTNIDSLSILYLTSSDLINSTFLLSSTINFYTITNPSTIDTIIDIFPDQPTTTVNKPADVTGLIIAIFIVLFILTIIGILSCIWQRCGKKDHQRVNPNDNNHVLLRGEIISIIPQEVMRRLSR